MKLDSPLPRIWLVICIGWIVMPAVADQPSPEALDFFEQRIRPIFVAHCYECHSTGSKKDNGSLLLDSGTCRTDTRRRLSPRGQMS